MQANIRSRMLLFLKGLFLMGLLITCMAHAEDKFIVGIGTHLMDSQPLQKRALQAAADAGISSVRNDAFWSTAEPALNELRIIPPWETYLNGARNLRLSTLMILGYGAVPYAGAKPRTPNVKTAYLNYVDFVSRRLGNRVDFYEVWNEWDMDSPKDPKSSADYAALVKDTVPRIRQNNPQVKILAGAVTSQGMLDGFVDRVIDTGALKEVDGLSLHPYVHCMSMGRSTPESWANWMRGYEAHVRDRAKKTVALYLTEMGWPSHQGTCGISETRQAAYLARSFFLARTIPNIKGMWWYDLINDGQDKGEQEHNFGLLRPDFEPKPAYSVLKAITPVVREYTYDASTSVQTDDVYMLYFNKGPERVVVAWAASRSREKQVISNALLKGNVQLVDTAEPAKGLHDGGESWVCSGTRCTASVTLTEFPKVISLGANSSTVTGR